MGAEGVLSKVVVEELGPKGITPTLLKIPSPLCDYTVASHKETKCYLFQLYINIGSGTIAKFKIGQFGIKFDSSDPTINQVRANLQIILKIWMKEKKLGDKDDQPWLNLQDKINSCILRTMREEEPQFFRSLDLKSMSIKDSKATQPFNTPTVAILQDYFQTQIVFNNKIALEKEPFDEDFFINYFESFPPLMSNVVGQKVHINLKQANTISINITEKKIDNYQKGFITAITGTIAKEWWMKWYRDRKAFGNFPRSPEPDVIWPAGERLLPRPTNPPFNTMFRQPSGPPAPVADGFWETSMCGRGPRAVEEPPPPLPTAIDAEGE